MTNTRTATDTNRDEATGRFVDALQRPCRCGHQLGNHTAARRANVQQCLTDGCSCESFKRTRAAR